VARRPTNLELEFSAEDIAKLYKPVSPSHGFSIAFWFLTQVGNAERAKALLDIAIYAKDKLDQLTVDNPVVKTTTPAENKTASTEIDSQKDSN